MNLTVNFNDRIGTLKGCDNPHASEFLGDRHRPRPRSPCQSIRAKKRKSVALTVQTTWRVMVRSG